MVEAEEGFGKGVEMSRTVMNLRDDLVGKTGRLTGVMKKVEVVDLVLEELVRRKEARKILELAGKVEWVGDLKEMRRGRKIDFSR